MAAVKALAGPAQQNALAVGEALLAGDVCGALTQVDGLMAANEPPLRLVASLVSQLRGWLWLTLLEQSGARPNSDRQGCRDWQSQTHLRDAQTITGHTATKTAQVARQASECRSRVKARQPSGCGLSGWAAAGPERIIGSWVA